MILRTHTCNELRSTNINQPVTLMGWVHRLRDKGGLLWIDLRDGYGVTQLFLEESTTDPNLLKKARQLGREFVIQATGTVIERQSKNSKMATGDIEIQVSALTVVSRSKTPPFTLEDKTDGGDELRMKYRYLDLRREPLHKNLQLRHLLAKQTRLFLDGEDFLEVETPMLIKSTPEGARDFVVPSRLNKGEFYALPQSPQVFKQLLVVSGVDRYYQIVKCFRDEDFRADRQPEFTQIDCEMAFVEQEDVLSLFERFIIHLFKEVKGVKMSTLPRMSYEDAIKHYGSDKPDTRFAMPLVNLNETVKGKGFPLFDQAELVVGICAQQCASYTRKQIDALAGYIKEQQKGAAIPLIYARCNTDGSFKSSVDKFYNQSELEKWAQKMNAKPNDLILILAGNKDDMYNAMGELRLHVGNLMGLRDNSDYAAVWVVDFPLFEWDQKSNRFYAKHHPFTAPKPEDISLLDSDPGKVRANAYDLVINGTEIGGGSIRIHDSSIQQRVFKKLGFTGESADRQFGFLMDAFEYGAPPHGGIAIGFDRLCALFGGADSIRDFIAFPKNNAGKDVMINSPSSISREQLDELGIALKKTD